MANPELRRNLWLEATPARLVLTPLILGGIFFLTFVSDGHQLGATTAVAALLCLGVLTWGWGGHLASESILSEVRGRTWDWQRMSGLGAWTLTWGKLVGATVMPWYGAAWCLAVYTLAQPEDETRKVWLGALVVLAGVLGQAATFLVAVHAASRGRVAARAQSSVYLFVAVIIGLQVVGGAARGGSVSWYGLEPSPVVFAAASVAAFAAFALAGAWVRVRSELRFRTLPLVWPAFVLFAMGWAAGFPSEPGELALARRAVAFLVAVAATWAAALLDPKDPVALRRLLRFARERRWRALTEALPPWVLTLPFVALAWLSLFVAPPTRGPGESDARVVTAAVVLFLLRDLAVILHLSLGARPRRADLFAIILLVAGYVLLPLVLSASGARAAAALFFPDPDRALVSAASALAQAGLAAALLAGRWRARERGVGGAGG